MSNLEGKIIIVTGSTQGVGAAIATHCAQQGAAGLVICGRNKKKGGIVAQSIYQCPIEFVQADLEKVQDCRKVVHCCDEKFGRVDGLVNAAALTSRGTLDETSVEVWDQLFAINARAPFLLSQETVKIMRREKIPGSIVNILSICKYCGPEFVCAYSATKGALATFTKNIANHLLFDRIRVNGINLGWTDTPNEHLAQMKMGQPESWLEHAESVSPFGRLIKPIDVARLTVFLLSESSGVMTGSLIDQAQRVIGSVTTPRVDDAG